MPLPGSEITNKVELTARENTSAICIINTTVGSSDLNITKIASANLVPPGKNLTYTIIYRNNGSIKQTNVTIHDWLDPYVDLANGKHPKRSHMAPGRFESGRGRHNNRKCMGKECYSR